MSSTYLRVSGYFMDTVLNSIKTILRENFKGEILKFILIGSRTSSTQKDNSDYDIIIVTRNVVDSYDFVKNASRFISKISFENKSNIEIYPVKEKNLNNTSSQFINNVILNGIEF